MEMVVVQMVIALHILEHWQLVKMLIQHKVQVNLRNVGRSINPQIRLLRVLQGHVIMLSSQPRPHSTQTHYAKHFFQIVYGMENQLVDAGILQLPVLAI